MNTKKTRERKTVCAQPLVTIAKPLATARQRLHANIERLLSLHKQLHGDQTEQAKLLTAIQLVGFKVQHLAWQIQKDENLSTAM